MANHPNATNNIERAQLLVTGPQIYSIVVSLEFLLKPNIINSIYDGF